MSDVVGCKSESPNLYSFDCSASQLMKTSFDELGACRHRFCKNRVKSA